MAEWIKASFKGDAQVLPPVCPNCLGQADTQVSIDHRFLNETHTQTFLYCKPCGEQAAHAPSLFLDSVGGMIMSLVPAMVYIFAVYPMLPEAMKGATLIGKIVGVTPVLMIVAGTVGFPIWSKKRALKKYPPRAGQITWGPAAYYIGRPGLGFGGGATYKALRVEWLRELVRHNQDQAGEEALKLLK